VPDRETKELMVNFYDAYLGGMSASVALRYAVLKCRDARLKAKGAAHPFYWGAFVMIGNPGKLN
jgi:CHAT domain-containing protein